MTFIALVPEIYYNVKQYGAAGDGSTDDTTAINNTITAAAAGGIVYFPPGTYKTSGSLIFTADSIILRGAGWKSIIQPASSSNFDVISSPIPGSAGLSGYVRNYIGIEDLKLDCSNMTGTTAGQGNGIHFYGVRYGHVRNVFIASCPNWAILLDGDNTGPGNNFGYDNEIHGCIFDLCNGNAYQTNCEANRFTETQFKWCGGTLAAAQPVFGSTSTTGYHLRLSSGYAYVAGNVFGNGGSYTTPAILTENNGPCRIIGNRFDQVRYQAVVLNGGNHIFAFSQLGTPSEIGTTQAIQIGSNNNTIIGNKFDNTAGAYHHTYAVAESGGPFTGNVITGNFLAAGSSGTVLTTAGSTHVLHSNIGYHSELQGASISTVTTTYQVLDSDSVVLTDSTSAAFTVTLPNPRLGYTLMIKDSTGQAATHNITLNTLASAKIDGASSGTPKITTNYGSYHLVSNGTDWFTV